VFRVNETYGIELDPVALMGTPSLQAFCILVDEARGRAGER
jgi:hypothetical protein